MLWKTTEYTGGLIRGVKIYSTENCPIDVLVISKKTNLEQTKVDGLFMCSKNKSGSKTDHWDTPGITRALFDFSPLTSILPFRIVQQSASNDWWLKVALVIMGSYKCAYRSWNIWQFPAYSRNFIFIEGKIKFKRFFLLQFVKLFFIDVFPFL